MTIITKTKDDVTVVIDSNKRDCEFITLIKDGKTITTGYEHITQSRSINAYNPPAGTVTLLKSSDKIQPLGQSTSDLISDALNEYNNLDEIKLPRERRELVSNIETAYDEHDYKNDQDYNNDIGFHQSAKTEAAIDAAEQALKDFDLRHPELAAEIAKEKAAETAQHIQSALNA